MPWLLELDSSGAGMPSVSQCCNVTSLRKRGKRCSDRHRIGAMLRRSSALSAVQVHRDKGVAQIVHLFSTMRSHGLGLDVGAVGAHDSLLFQKTLWCDLSEFAAKFLFELRISPTSFGAAISKRSRYCKVTFALQCSLTQCAKL